jgi:hypothetical protein
VDVRYLNGGLGGGNHVGCDTLNFSVRGGRVGGRCRQQFLKRPSEARVVGIRAKGARDLDGIAVCINGGVDGAGDGTTNEARRTNKAYCYATICRISSLRVRRWVRP